MSYDDISFLLGSRLVSVFLYSTDVCVRNSSVGSVPAVEAT